MTIRRSMLGVFCAGAIAVPGPRAAYAAEPPATAQVSALDRARVLAQIDTVRRRGFLYEVTRDESVEGSRGKAQRWSAARDDAGRGPAPPANSDPNDDGSRGPAQRPSTDDASRGPAQPSIIATDDDRSPGPAQPSITATDDDQSRSPGQPASTATYGGGVRGSAQPSIIAMDDDAARAKKRLFLYGTIHVGRVGSEPFNAAVMHALRASRRLALEADPSDDAATRELAIQLGQYPANDGLRRHVPPALLARVAAFGERNGLSHDRIERFRPWLLANMVTVRQFGDSGLDADLGSELYLAGFARSVAMPIVEVEGLESQLRLLAASPDAVQTAELDEALSDDPGDATDDTRALFDLWLTGDAGAGDRLIDAMHREASGRVFERYLVDTLIDARNRRMVDALEVDFSEPGSTFFAVGALHLFGERGLVRELERRGYRVTDLQPPLATR